MSAGQRGAVSQRVSERVPVTELGVPLWTQGHFSRIAAQDDLGIEALGAGLLRELVPGVVQTSISAGYYAYYPFLLDEFERRWPDELARSEFQRFYRRQEAAFAAACSHHDHRGNLRGINGINAAWQAVEDAGASGSLNLTDLAGPNRYMKTGLGGYGLFYRPALEDIGATRLGSGHTYVDRATDAGRAASEGFRAAIAATEYWKSWWDADAIPLGVLEELGEATCPCQVPGRPDQEAILDLFFGEPPEGERWEVLRSYRVQSLGLLLEFHAQRPQDLAGLGEWRRALISGRIGGVEWDTAFVTHREAWRAYQYRETLVAALTTVFTDLLLAFEELGAASVGGAVDLLMSRLTDGDLHRRGRGTFGELSEDLAPTRADPAGLVALAEEAMSAAQPATVGDSLTSAVTILAALAVAPTGSEEFEALLERGEAERFSVAYISRWLQARADQFVESVVRELLWMLVHRHLRVAAAKVSATDHRDPYCLAEVEDGVYEVIRPDEPFWTGARFATLNHLLWSLGALDDPDGAGRPTALGEKLLNQAVGSG
ncbi:MAG: hypothetical protein JJU45_11965 [Acidimicrobiia bacterium]|nr:hypothetical protein [Acidimicrobiia bacterium]